MRQLRIQHLYYTVNREYFPTPSFPVNQAVEVSSFSFTRERANPLPAATTCLRADRAAEVPSFASAITNVI